MKNQINKLTFKKTSLYNPLNSRLVKKIIKLYELSDPHFFNLLKKNKIDIDYYVENLINKENSSLEKFNLVYFESNLVGFYNINDENNFQFRNLNNILILKKLFNSKNLIKIQKIMSNHFILTKLPEKSLYIDTIVLNKKFQSKGYGSVIVNRIISKSKFKKISLHVNKTNKNAIYFYLKNKFYIFDENNNYYSLVYEK